jgi:hypothetical protein
MCSAFLKELVFVLRKLKELLVDRFGLAVGGN